MQTSSQGNLSGISHKAMAGAIVALGALVLLGWYTQNTALIQVNAAFVPMQYNTALGFLLCGVGLFMVHSRVMWVGLGTGIALMLLGLLTLSQYLLGVDFHIDQLFMEHYIDVSTSHPGRMAPNTALCFTLSGVALTSAALRWELAWNPAAILGAVVFALGVVAFGGYAANVETAYGWGALTKMAVHTALGFIVMGTGLVMSSLDRFRAEHSIMLPAWLPWAAALGGITLTFATWQAASAYEESIVARLGSGARTIDDESVLLFGALATVSFFFWLRNLVYRANEGKGDPRRFALLFVLNLGIALSLGIHQVVDGIYKESVATRFEIATTNHVNAITRGLAPYVDALHDIRDAFAAYDTVTREQFGALVAHDLEVLEGIVSLQWAPLVTSDQRAEFEQDESLQVSRPIEIMEFDFAKEQQIVARQRPIFFPVSFYEPIAGNEVAHGYDFGATREGIDYLWSAAEADKLLTSEPAQVFQLDDGYGFFLALPVYQNNVLLETPTQRKQGLRGFAIVVLEFGPMLESILTSHTQPAGIDLEFRDVVDSVEVLVYRHESRTGHKGEAEPLTTIVPLTVGDRLWQVTSIAADTERYATWSSSNLILPFITLFLTIVLATYLRRSAQREDEMAGLVKELKRSEHLYSNLVGSIPGASFSALIEDGVTTPIFFSKAIEELTGYAPEEFVQGSIRVVDLVHPEDKADLDQRVQQSRSSSGVYNVEYRIIHRDGTERWVYSQANSTPQEGEGEQGKRELSGTLLDITSRKHSEERFRGLLESAPDSMVIVDEEGTISFINEQTVTLFGYTVNELVGEKIEKLLPERYQTEHPGLRQSFFDAPSVREMGSGKELRALRKDGGEIPVEISLSPLQTSTGLLVSAAVRDITRRKEMEAELILARDRAEEATLAKSEFLANMSHEIRTPMNSIIGMSHLVLQTELAPKQKNHIEKVHRSAESLLNIINDILDYSKIEAGKLELESAPFGLDSVFHNLVNILGLQAEDKNLELLFDIPSDIPMELVGDSLRLEQVLLNLGNNAIKFTEDGEVVISVRALEQTETTVRFEFSVRDTGVGLSTEEQARLFQPFSQADSSTTRKYGGSGLGLTICKRIVEAYGGEIGLESSPGQGSCFTFSIDLGMNMSGEERPRLAPSEMTGLRVLVVDDNASSREILAGVLASFGFIVDVCTNGKAAIERIKDPEALSIDLVVLDWKMPELDGIETARMIQSGGADAPTCVMVTAYGKDEASEAANDVDISAFLTKPVTPSTLLDAVMFSMGKSDRVVQSGRIATDTSRWVEQLVGAKILLVEDNELNQEVASELLTLNGLEVEIAENGEEAIHMLELGKYDGVLMDCQMPVMDGYAATQEIRKQPRYKELPILAMTANAMAGDRERAIDAGMNDHIAKPVDPEDLFRTMARWITPSTQDNSTQAANPAEAVPKKTDSKESDIPGVDKTLGLRYTQNNQALYTKMLTKFATSNKDFAHEFENAQKEEPEKAMRMAHTLKSNAGSIGATELADQAATLESACRQGDEGIMDSLLSQLASSLESIVSAIQRSEEQNAGSADLSLQQELEQIMAQIRESDSDSLDNLEKVIQGAAIPDELIEPLSAARDALQDFEFETAAETLEKALKEWISGG